MKMKRMVLSLVGWAMVAGVCLPALAAKPEALPPVACDGGMGHEVGMPGHGPMMRGEGPEAGGRNHGMRGEGPGPEFDRPGQDIGFGFAGPVLPLPFLLGLKLSEEQLDKMFIIDHQFALQIHEKRRAADKNRAALRELAIASKFDEAKARELANGLGAALGELSFLQAQKDAQLQAVLTLEQRADLASRKDRREPPAPNREAEPRKK